MMLLLCMCAYIYFTCRQIFLQKPPLCVVCSSSSSAAAAATTEAMFKHKSLYIQHCAHFYRLLFNEVFFLFVFFFFLSSCQQSTDWNSISMKISTVYIAHKSAVFSITSIHSKCRITLDKQLFLIDVWCTLLISPVLPSARFHSICTFNECITDATTRAYGSMCLCVFLYFKHIFYSWSRKWVATCLIKISLMVDSITVHFFVVVVRHSVFVNHFQAHFNNHLLLIDVFLQIIKIDNYHDVLELIFLFQCRRQEVYTEEGWFKKKNQTSTTIPMAVGVSVPNIVLIMTIKTLCNNP